ncbi:methyltransferase domain-containing protein [uncultured Aliiroseovarius sp.]|uniref:class I SAM-dependent methyltransferase n=1 Tax=uncultured Aliiroseovarius sp. TaxID=1658783 RepID=UPI0026162C11|nr:methyltransferase domain-containing protein [uncultured Aliiroseovarius sp.]
MSHVYSNEFFDYIDSGVTRSAEALIGSIIPQLQPSSVVDFGCGRGLWLAEWSRHGVGDVIGIDGDYVDRDRLSIPKSCFKSCDLTKPIDLERKFDLCVSLEVAEHLAPQASDEFVKTLVKHSDCVMFSAAVPGQGGEFHINERPLEFWRGLFKRHGYQAYDFVRPLLKDNKNVEPWYRFNTILYANATGQSRLPMAVLDTLVEDTTPIADVSSIPWKLRKLVVRRLPIKMATQIAQARAAIIAKRVKAR